MVKHIREASLSQETCIYVLFIRSMFWIWVKLFFKVRKTHSDKDTFLGEKINIKKYVFSLVNNIFFKLKN